MSWRAVAVIMLSSWGAAAFGAVYPWAFVPLFGASAAVGGASLLQRTRSGKTEMILTAALMLLLIAISLQLVPVSVDSIRRISSETNVILARYALGYPSSH